MTDRVSPVVPVLHHFEWDAKRNRISGIRFANSDGSTVRVAARVTEVEVDERPSAEVIRLVDVRA